MNKTNYFIVPGLGNSGPAHWQSFFEKSGTNFRRINQKNWDAPDCSDWIKNINNAISEFDPASVVLIGHSLGCVTIAHWAAQSKTPIKGALLVGPSDIEAPLYTFPSSGFTPIPMEKLNFKTIVVASDNDPWVSVERARLFASNWGSEYISIGVAGHINADSGFGDWPHGLEILKTIG